jgi:hypothetical protein
MKVLRFLKLAAMILAALFLIACGGGGGGVPTESTPPSGNTAGIVYVKASNTGIGDLFGSSVAISADGNTLAVGAPGEFSSATGINGNQSDNSAPGSGAVYVFTRDGSTWTQQAYIKASNTEASENNDNFGFSIALSADGGTLVVGAPGEDSSATGINGDQSNNSAAGSGAVYVFTRSGTIWNQEAYVKASNTRAGDGFGTSVAISSDGNTLAVGAPGEDSSATGIDGNQSDNSASASGAAYAFTRSGTTWSQQAYVKASNTEEGDWFGFSIALSPDGNTLAVGAPKEDSSATGIGGDQNNNSVSASGAVYVFIRSGAAWSQQAYVKASNTGSDDNFGSSVVLSADGNTLAVGTPGEDSSATGIGGNQNDNSASASGAVYVFTRSGTTWSQQAYVKASNTGTNDLFGNSVSLSSDGNKLAVGAPVEASNATGLNGDQNDNSAYGSGAVYVFTRSGTTWSQQTYVKASNTGVNDLFGSSVSLTSDGSTLAVGANGESSGATGIDGNQSDNSVTASGAVYLY